jgi:hypothetical protein
LLVSCETGRDPTELSIQGWVDQKYLRNSLSLTVFVDGLRIGHQTIETGGIFTLKFPLLKSLHEGIHSVEIQSSAWFVPHHFLHNGDYRPLSFRMEKIHF